MADFIARILTHEILKALFPYVIIIMVGVIISRLGKLILKLNIIIEHFNNKNKGTKTDTKQDQNTKSNQEDKTENNITYF